MDWNQARTILWLRWRLTRNQWSRGSALNVVITMIVAVVVLLIGLAGSVFGVLAGMFLLNRGPALNLLAAWDVIVAAFLFLWMMGLISEIQRSEMIDIGRMLHLPISLKQVFFINYLASHLTLSLALFVPGMLGLCLGLILGRGWLMMGLVPLAVGLIFMVTAWTYCLRGWLVTLMSNPRRRRAVIAAVTFTAVMLGQLPNLLNLTHRHSNHQYPAPVPVQPGQIPNDVTIAKGPPPFPPWAWVVHEAVPFLWVSYGATALAQGNAWPVLWGSAASFGIGALGLRRAYRSTIRFYQGQVTSRKAAAKAKAKSQPASRTSFIEKRLPGIPEEAAATGLATLRSLTRAPEVKMALAMNVFMIIVFGGMFLFQHSRSPGDAAKPFIATGVVAFLCFTTLQLLFNQFGYDRAGFRAIVLSPAPRRWVLLGKNLALLPVVASLAGVLLILIRLVLDVPLLVILAAAIQLLAAFLLLSTAGNLVSMLMPYRIAPGSLKPTKMPTGTTFLFILLHLLFPLMVAPIFLAPLAGALLSTVTWLPSVVVNFLVSSILLALAAVGYSLALPSLGALLQRREKRILEIVTHEVE